MPSHTPVIALSRGLGSRILAAGVNQQTDDLNAATMTVLSVSNVEVEAARQVADVLGIPWDGFEVTRSATHMDRMWELKQEQMY
jgi:tRNA U34 2-thiouridine synthase MnmA/TrmU